MRIIRLTLRDYRCFKELDLAGLGDRVVLVGPNGCGKSSVLEAIAALKEFVGSYLPQDNPYWRSLPLAQKHAIGWPANVPLPVRDGQPSAFVSADIELDEIERGIGGAGAIARAQITIARTGEVSVELGHQGLRTLFRHYDPASGTGVIDYIGASRVLPVQQVTSLNLDTLSIEQQRRERVELQRPDLNYQKFRSIKQYIISQELEDLGYLKSYDTVRDSIVLLRELFAEFFSPKKLIGYRPRNGEMQVAVQTPYGCHDIDELSSGERELLFVLVNLFRIRGLPSVILYDEPERHLNAGLEAKLLPALDRLETRNQLWIATHGLELIGSVPLNEVVALKHGPDGPQAERFDDDSRVQRVRLLETLGARVGLQLASTRVVFVEGKQADADKRILDRLLGPKLSGVTFVAAGPASGVMGAGTHAAQLLEEASKDASFLMVLDRDFRDSASVAELQRKLRDRAFVWGCHEIENTLLVPEAILAVLDSFDERALTTPAEVEGALLSAARSLEEMFVHKWAAYKLENGVGSGKDGVAAPRDYCSFSAWVDGRRRRFADAYELRHVEAVLGEVRDAIRNSYDDGTWRSVLPGKDILEGFRTRFLARLPGELFRAQLVHHIEATKQLPAEIDRLHEFIRAH